jgi:hypothetical protein
MQPIKKVLGILVLVASGISLGHGQRASEIYIPIGKSPGLSHTHTIIETISAIDPYNQTVVTDNQTILITDSTRIWLDRTKLAESNSIGSFTDLLPGRTIEVLLLESDDAMIADWVKVEIPQE